MILAFFLWRTSEGMFSSMGWATGHIEQLAQCEAVSFRPRGQSMRGKIRSGQLCHVAPIAPDTELKKGDIVLCKVRSAQYLHLIKAVKGERFQIGNNIGGINGWIRRDQIFGLLTSLGA